MIDLPEYFLAGAAGLLAGGVNAVAGGGSLISFPALLALGLPPLQANITNTVALCPGYLGGTLAQRRDLAGQGRRTWSLGAVAAVGGLAGSVLLVITSEDAFSAVIPFLILAACGLLAVQPRITALVTTRRGGSVSAAVADTPSRQAYPVVLNVAVLIAAAYGGYFGAGLGIMMLAILGMLIDERLTRLNATKQVLSAVINVVAAVFFLFSGEVVWGVAAVMASTSLIGGHLGGRLVTRLRPTVLRVAVIAYGVVVAIVLWVT